MSRVTEDDIGKPVIDAADETEVGVVAGVEGDTVYVEPDPDIADDARASLGWEELGEEYAVNADALQPIPGDEPDAFSIDLAAYNRGEGA